MTKNLFVNVRHLDFTDDEDWTTASVKRLSARQMQYVPMDDYLSQKKRADILEKGNRAAAKKIALLRENATEWKELFENMSIHAYEESVRAYEAEKMVDNWEKWSEKATGAIADLVEIASRADNDIDERDKRIADLEKRLENSEGYLKIARDARDRHWDSFCEMHGAFCNEEVASFDLMEQLINWQEYALELEDDNMTMATGIMLMVLGK